jgi:hypothetical protein
MAGSVEQPARRDSVTIVQVLNRRGAHATRDRVTIPERCQTGDRSGSLFIDLWLSWL